MQVLELPYHVYLKAVQDCIFDDPKCAQSLLLGPSERDRVQKYRDYRTSCILNMSLQQEVVVVDETAVPEDGSANSSVQAAVGSMSDSSMRLMVAALHLHPGNCSNHSGAGISAKQHGGFAGVDPDVSRVATPPPPQHRPSQARPSRVDPQQQEQQEQPHHPDLHLPKQPATHAAGT